MLRIQVRRVEREIEADFPLFQLFITYAFRALTARANINSHLLLQIEHFSRRKAFHRLKSKQKCPHHPLEKEGE